MTQLLRNLGTGRRAVDLTTATYGYTGEAADMYGIDIKPTNDYIAVVGTSSNKTLSVWSWNGNATVSQVAYVNNGSPDMYSCWWHPTTSYIATSNVDATHSAQVFSFTGGNTLTEVAYAGLTGGSSMVDWHPNGNFLAASAYTTSNNLKVYSWNGSNSLTEVESLSTGSNTYTVRWSPDGNYLAVSSADASKELIIYSWNGTDTLTEVASYNNDVTIYDTVWTSDNAYIFCGCSSTTTSARVLYFDGSSLTLKDTVNSGLTGYTVDLYRDKYLALCTYSTPGTNSWLKYYSFSRTTETLTAVDTWSEGGSGLLSVNFNPSGTYLAVGTYAYANRSFFVVRV